MGMFMRIGLFLITNLAIMLMVGIVLKILGLQAHSMGGIVVMALIVGMGGSFISLAMSKWLAKKSVGAEVIKTPSNPTETWLVETVRRQATAAGIGMPEVAIYEAPEMNAFATGMTKNSSLVAVSSGLLQGMNQEEVEAVLAHEISHISNGDMVTMALIQGILNTFVIILARIVGTAVDNAMRSSDDESNTPGIGYYIASFIAELIFGIIASIIVMWFSRQREFRADAGSARLESPQKMIHALQRLQQVHIAPLPDSMRAFGIAQGESIGFFQKMFMSHPPLEERIAALQNMR
jgi:heat shock protein HtpX